MQSWNEKKDKLMKNVGLSVRPALFTNLELAINYALKDPNPGRKRHAWLGENDGEENYEVWVTYTGKDGGAMRRAGFEMAI